MWELSSITRLPCARLAGTRLVAISGAERSQRLARHVVRRKPDCLTWSIDPASSRSSGRFADDVH